MTSNFKGTMFIVLAGFFWGTMGVGAKYLMGNYGFVPEDLCTVRLLCAGFLTLLISLVTGNGIGLNFFKDKKNVFGFLLVGIFILSSQFTFMKSVMLSTAGTATILLTTVPLWAAAWGAITEHKPVKRIEIFCFFLATIGVIFIVTKGNFGSLDMPILGVLWALFSAMLSAGYTIESRGVIMRTSVFSVIGWGMLFGGLISSFFSPPWSLHGVFTWESSLTFAYVVFFGTVVAFNCYMAGLKYISAVVAGLLVCTEPLFAYIFQAILLGETVGLVEFFGILLILCNVLLLGIPEKYLNRLTGKFKKKIA